MKNINEELNYIIDEFKSTKIVRLKEDREIHICSYNIGNNQNWISIFEDFGGDDWSRVNIYGKAMKELYKILKEIHGE